MASFRAVRRAFCTAAETTPAPAPAPVPAGRWERLKNSKAGVWCRSLLSDYKEACKEIVVGARDRPLKASVYMGLLGGAYACFTTKPDQSSFQAALLDRSNQLGLLSPWIRNGSSDLHVQNLVKLRNQGCLHHLSLGLFSLVYSSDNDTDSALYEARCSNLSVPWRELPNRVLDVGFVGRWWVLEKKMEDFDVNEAEYKHLPAHMQATLPPSVQEVERNEKLHKESWLPILGQEEETTGDRKEDTQAKIGNVKTVDVQEENTDTNVDTKVNETVEAIVQSEAVETVDANVLSQNMEMVDANVDSKLMETQDENMDVQIMDTVDANADSKVMEMLDANMNSQNMETVGTNVGSHDAKTVDILDDSLIVEAVYVQEDNGEAKLETGEPVQQSAASV